MKRRSINSAWENRLLHIGDAIAQRQFLYSINKIKITFVLTFCIQETANTRNNKLCILTTVAITLFTKSRLSLTGMLLSFSKTCAREIPSIPM